MWQHTAQKSDLWKKENYFCIHLTFLLRATSPMEGGKDQASDNLTDEKIDQNLRMVKWLDFKKKDIGEEKAV